MRHSISNQAMAYRLLAEAEADVIQSHGDGRVRDLYETIETPLLLVADAAQRATNCESQNDMDGALGLLALAKAAYIVCLLPLRYPDVEDETCNSWSIAMYEYLTNCEIAADDGKVKDAEGALEQIELYFSKIQVRADKLFRKIEKQNKKTELDPRSYE